MRAELEVDPNLNVRKWALSAGVSESGVRGFLSGYQENITLEYVEKLAAARGKTLYDFVLPMGGAAFAKWLSLLDNDEIKVVQRLFQKTSPAVETLPSPLRAGALPPSLRG